MATAATTAGAIAALMVMPLQSVNAQTSGSTSTTVAP